MRDDLRERLERQAAWQRARSSASWADKLRTAVILRQAALALREAPAASTEGARRPRDEILPSTPPGLLNLTQEIARVFALPVGWLRD